MATTIITEQPIEHRYTAIAGQTDFDFDFQIFNGVADLVVTINEIVTSSYSITLTGAEGGFITINPACALGDLVVIRRDLQIERVTQFPVTGPVGMPTVNHELNRIVGMIQQVDYILGQLILTLNYGDENVLDVMGIALVGGPGILVQPNDAANTITITASMDSESVRDLVGATLVAGAGIEIVVNDAGNIVTIQSTGGGGGGGLTTEDVRDVIGTALVAGAGIGITVDDALDKITISNLSGGYTAENARDDIGAALVAGVGIDITVDDNGNFIGIHQHLGKTLSYFIPAGAMTPRATGGAQPGTFETATTFLNFDCYDFDQATVEVVQFIWRMPKQIQEDGQISVSFGWTSGAASGGVRWGIAGAVLRDGLDLNQGMAVFGALTDVTNGPNKLNVSDRTLAGGIPGLVSEDLVLFSVIRDAGEGSDTLAGDAKLLWVDLKVPIVGFDDA
jgi:hypothetical protein